VIENSARRDFTQFELGRSLSGLTLVRLKDYPSFAMGRPQLASVQHRSDSLWSARMRKVDKHGQDACEYDFSTLHGLVDLSLFGLT